jgi:hypothetical protein
MKRKTPSKPDNASKRPKTSVESRTAAAAIRSVLSSYYSRVKTLRDHLQERLPLFSQKLDLLPLEHDVVSLIDTVMVASDGLITEPAIKSQLVAFTSMIRSRRPQSQMDNDLGSWSQKDASNHHLCTPC